MHNRPTLIFFISIFDQYYILICDSIIKNSIPIIMSNKGQFIRLFFFFVWMNELELCMFQQEPSTATRDLLSSPQKKLNQK